MLLFCDIRVVRDYCMSYAPLYDMHVVRICFVTPDISNLHFCNVYEVCLHMSHLICTFARGSCNTSKYVFNKNILRTSAVSSREFRVNTHLSKLRCWYL